MDDLFNLLMQRQLAQTGSNAPNLPVPATPPTPSTKVPQRAKRFDNAQQIQDAYRNGWQPNPILLRAQLGHR